MLQFLSNRNLALSDIIRTNFYYDKSLYFKEMHATIWPIIRVYDENAGFLSVMIVFKSNRHNNIDCETKGNICYSARISQIFYL